MSETSHLEPLLHLAGLGVGLTFAYLGLDRWGTDSAVAGLLDGLWEQVRTKLDGYLDEAGEGLALDSDFMQDKWRVYRLCVIAEFKKKPDVTLDEQKKARRYFWVVNFFRKRMDRAVVGWLAVSTTAGFLLLVISSCPGTFSLWRPLVHLIFAIDVAAVIAVVGLVLVARRTASGFEANCANWLAGLEILNKKSSATSLAGIDKSVA